MPVIEAREPTVFVISMKEILRVGTVIEAVFVLSDPRGLLIWRRGWNVTPNVGRNRMAKSAAFWRSG